MENEVTIENISKRQRTILIIYVIVLGIIGITVLLLTILAFTLGAGAFAMQIFQSIYYVIIYIITNSSFEKVSWNPSLLFTLLSLLLLFIISISAVGAYKIKKWGHMLNIFFLGIVFPIFFTMPTAVLWFLPRSREERQENLKNFAFLALLAVQMGCFSRRTALFDSLLDIVEPQKRPREVNFQ